MCPGAGKVLIDYPCPKWVEVCTDLRAEGVAGVAGGLSWSRSRKWGLGGPHRQRYWTRPRAASTMWNLETGEWSWTAQGSCTAVTLGTADPGESWGGHPAIREALLGTVLGRGASTSRTRRSRSSVMHLAGKVMTNKWFPRKQRATIVTGSVMRSSPHFERHNRGSGEAGWVRKGFLKKKWHLFWDPKDDMLLNKH